jgi:predicted HTH domain antitoxin
MHAVKVHELKNNPSEALRRARKGPVIVMKGDEPEAVIFHLDSNALLSEPGMRLALATALFAEGHLSLGRAAGMANMPLAEFIPYLGSRGIPAITGTAEDARKDLEVLRKWGKSS